MFFRAEKARNEIKYIFFLADLIIIPFLIPEWEDCASRTDSCRLHKLRGKRPAIFTENVLFCAEIPRQAGNFGKSENAAYIRIKTGRKPENGSVALKSADF